MLRRSMLFRRSLIAEAIVVTPPPATSPVLERPRINGTPTVGVPLSYTTSRLSVAISPVATRIKVAGATVASGTTSASYTPVAGDVPGNIVVEHDYTLADSSTITAKSYPEPIYSDEWMTPVPVPRDTGVALTSAAQPGTRLLYVANGGAASNRTDVGKFYLWTGSTIVDSAGNTSNPVSGLPYGTDPLNPGAGIVPWGKYAAVAHTYYGQEPGARENAGGWEYGYGPSSSAASGRTESPDWILFKRGETFDLAADLAAYKAEMTALSITNTVTISTLTSRGGLTWAGRQVFGSYGNAATTERARIKSPTGVGFASRSYAVWRNAQYFGLIFDTMDTPAGVSMKYGFTSVGTSIGSDNVWFTDVRFAGCPSFISDDAQQHIRIDRCMVVDVHNSIEDVTAIYTGGGNQSRMQVKESFMARCGHLMNPRNIEENWTSIPAHNPASAYASRALVKVGTRVYFAKRAIAAGTAWNYDAGGGWNDARGDWFLCGVDGYAVGSPYSRANYWSGEINPDETLFTDSISMAHASGDQISRSGARVTRNYFFTGYFGQAGHGGHPDSYGPTGCCEYNVLMRLNDGTSGNPGWGYTFGMGMAFASVRYNIDSHAMSGVQNFAGIKLTAVNWETSTGYYYHYAARFNVFEFNILGSGSAAPINVEDGLGGSDTVRHPDYGTGPGVLSNQFVNNWLVSTSGADYSYTRTNAAPLTDLTQTYLAGNQKLATAAALAASLGGSDPTRTHVTYLTSLGQSVTTSRGVAEWIVLWEGQRRGNWNPALTGKALGNHIRTGWGMAPLA